MEPKERLLKALGKKLSANDKELLKLVTIENRKEGVTVRMPIGVISLEGLWEKISAVGTGMNIACYKAGEFATLEELDSLLGDIEWLWHPWIPKGFVTMVAGDPGIGKSAIVQHFVKIITDGGTFPLETTPLPYPSNTIWIDTEASQQILKVRAKTMGIDKKRVYLPVINGDILSQANLGFEQDREQIINLIEGVEPELLVLDSLGGSHAKGENKVEDIRPILEFLALLARDYQMAVVVIHHLNKGKIDESPEVSLYRIRGSTVIPAYCRSIFAVEKGHSEANKIRMVKTNLARAPKDPIAVIAEFDEDEEICGFRYETYVPPPPKRNKKEACADWVLKLLKQHPDGMEFAVLTEEAEKVGYNRQNLYAAKDIIGDQVTFGGVGNRAHWQLTQTDKETLKILSSGNGKVKHGKRSKTKSG